MPIVQTVTNLISTATNPIQLAKMGELYQPWFWYFLGISEPQYYVKTIAVILLILNILNVDIFIRVAAQLQHTLLHK